MQKHHMKDTGWLSEALAEALGVPMDVPFEAWIANDGRIRCRACIAREIEREFADRGSEIAPTLLGALIRLFEPLVEEVK